MCNKPMSRHYFHLHLLLLPVPSLRPVSINCQVTWWSSFDHFARKSPRLFFISDIASQLVWRFGDVAKADCWVRLSDTVRSLTIVFHKVFQKGCASVANRQWSGCSLIKPRKPTDFETTKIVTDHARNNLQSYRVDPAAVHRYSFFPKTTID